MMNSESGKRIHLLLLTAVFAVGLLLRMAMVVHNSRNPLLYDARNHASDAHEYDSIAKNLLAGKGYSVGYDADPPLTMNRMPGYPFFLAGIYSISGPSPAAARTVQVLIDMLVCLMIYRFTLAVQRHSQVALLAAAAYMLHPLFWLHAAMLISDSLSVPFFVLAILVFYAGTEKADWKSYALSGVLLGIATLIRPTYLVMPLAMLVILLILQPKQIVRSVALTAVCSVALMMVLTPWIIRNYNVYHKFLPTVSANGYGFNLFAGAGPNHGETINSISQLPPTHPVRQEAERTSEVDCNGLYFREGIKLIKSDPANYMRLLVKKPFRLWFNLLHADPPSKSSMGVALLNLLVFIFAGIGMAKCHFPRSLTVVVLVLFVYWTAVHAFSQSHVRYAMSILPLIFPYTAAGFWWSVERVRGGK